MKSSTLHTYSALFFCALIALAGCSPTASAPVEQAMGRYVEEAFAFPENLSNLRYIGEAGNGDLLLVGNGNKEEYNWDMRMWRSTDDGATWKEDIADWMYATTDQPLYAFTFDKDGAPYFGYEKPDPEWDALAESGDEAAMAAYTYDPPPILTTFRDGALVDTGLGLAQQDAAYEAEDIRLADNGDIIATFYHDLEVIDPATGKVKATLKSESRLWQGFFFTEGDSVVVSDTAAMKFYSRDTGELIRELPFHNNASEDISYFYTTSGIESQTAIAPGKDGSAYYYCNKSGIYRVSADGLFNEKIVNGELNSLGMPTMTITQLLPRDDGSFLVHCTDAEDNNVLLRYRYDGAVPTVPSTELTVYSLRDAPTVRQAMGDFQRQNQDVKVTYDVGLAGDDSITLEDALRTLSTELLAGKGPDLLVLDGMPVASYREKGVLLDLAPVVDTDGLLPNIAGVYRQDDKLYAIPARFTMPMVLATRDVADSVRSLSALADFLATGTNPQFGMDTEEMLPSLYPIYQNNWFRTDGTLDDEALSRDLADIKRIYDLFSPEDRKFMFSSEGNLIGGASIWNGNALIDDVQTKGPNGIPLFIGTLRSMKDLAGPYTAIRDRGEGVFTAYPSTENAVFSPQVVMGINAAGSHTDLSARFLECMLSDAIQQNSLGDGLPVNKVALRQNEILPYEDEEGGTTFGTGYDTPDGEYMLYLLKTYWPDEAFFTDAMAILESADTPALLDSVPQSLILEEGQTYLDGAKSLPEAVATIKQKLDLYLAE